MKFITALSALAGAAAVNAQMTEDYLDTRTGIKFQTFTHERTGVSFGISLPENPTGTEFIGQLTAPITTGWAGVSFNGGMVNNLLMTAWVHNNEFKHALRISDSYTSAVVYTTPGPVMTPLFTEGAINATHWSFTFLCTNCNEWEIQDGEYTNIVDLASDFGVMGMGVSESELPRSPADAGSSLNKHSSSTQYGVLLGNARSADFEELKMAGLNGAAAPVPSAPSSAVPAANKRRSRR
ncbi:CBD9-like protein [Ascobolus immersus RN42]|uniref:CBD9-like protein n=1 Tax=Ascobolus immersus RN42 TaxID=1160509 RepID=A0A3N4I7D7_ASCIM|nr:CBD9-like protein [Ascobolus immersus RN42]